MSTALAVPAKALAPFRDALAGAQKHFQLALPQTVAKYLTPERLTKITLSAMSRNPVLLQCTPDSVLRSVMDAASLGLEPTGGVLAHGYLVPYKNRKTGRYEAQFIVGYQGLIELSRRSGEFQSLIAHPIYSRDTYEIVYGDEPRITHKPYTGSDEPGDFIGAYCVAKFKNGEKHVQWMTKREIDKHRASSRASESGPWVDWYEPMALKTVIKKAAKLWPKTAEITKALIVDAKAENQDVTVASDFDDLPHDALTGEVATGLSPVEEALAAIGQCKTLADLEFVGQAHKELPPEHHDEVKKAWVAKRDALKGTSRTDEVLAKVKQHAAESGEERQNG